MSKSRLANKLRQNSEYPAICDFLDTAGLPFELCQSESNSGGHPWIMITIPGVAEPVRHGLNCTPRAGGNKRWAISDLKRTLRKAGYKA